MLVLGAVVALVGCGQGVAPTAEARAEPATPPPILVQAERWPDPGFRSSSGAIEAGALTTDPGGNVRAAFWPTGVPDAADSTSCATWTRQDGDLVQQGAAFRIRSEDGHVRGLTVTKNVLYGASWYFNFHTWDTARPQRFQEFGQVELPAMQHRNRAAALPWRFCARLRGRTLEFKVWPGAGVEPAWRDPRWGGSATVPPGWDEPGRTGWYAGHLERGDLARFDQLATWIGTTDPADGRRGTRDSRPVVVRG